MTASGNADAQQVFSLGHRGLQLERGFQLYRGFGILVLQVVHAAKIRTPFGKIRVEPNHRAELLGGLVQVAEAHGFRRLTIILLNFALEIALRKCKTGADENYPGYTPPPSARRLTT